MDLVSLLGVAVYFAIGWLLSDLLSKEDSDTVKMFIFVAWPLMFALLAVAMLTVLVMGIIVFVVDLWDRVRGKDVEV